MEQALYPRLPIIHPTERTRDQDAVEVAYVRGILLSLHIKA